MLQVVVTSIITTYRFRFFQLKVPSLMDQNPRDPKFNTPWIFNIKKIFVNFSINGMTHYFDKLVYLNYR